MNIFARMRGNQGMVKKGFVSTLLFALVVQIAVPYVAFAANGSVKTTNQNCAVVNQNQYAVGEQVWAKGSNFDGNTSVSWDIQEVPPTTTVASGSVLTDANGDFCILLYTVQSGDSGVYKVTVDDKHDNYSVVGSNPQGVVVTPSTVSGMKFHDKNADGVQNNNEPALSGWTICAVDTTGISNNETVIVDSSSTTGVNTKNLPAGQYLLDTVGLGTISPVNGNPLARVDVEYTTNDGWTTHADGTTGYDEAGANQGDVMVNNNFISWGPYQTNHQYLTLQNLPAGASNFAFFDGDATTSTKIPAWYDDNSGLFMISMWFVLDCDVTNSSGEYTLDIPANIGSIRIYELPQAGWTKTYPVGEYHQTTIPANENARFDFGNNQDAGTPEEVNMNIHASKVVCKAEADLPNWGTGAGPEKIDANTAANFVADSDGNCWLEAGWGFQWGYADKDGQEGVDQLPGDWVGEGTVSGDTSDVWLYCGAPYCGPNTDTGSNYDQWHTFSTETDNNGSTPAHAYVSDLEGSSKIWVREINKEGYIPFSVPNEQYPGDDVSAEIYCHDDIINYDNLDYIASPQLGQDYYCVAFNTLKEDDGGGNPDPEDPQVSLHFYKQICSAYSDIYGNYSPATADATNGGYLLFGSGTVSEPISPSEFSDNEGCDPAGGWTFKLTTDEMQQNNMQETGETDDVNGGVTVELDDLNAELQAALLGGGKVWVSEIFPEDTTTTFGAIRCYNDALFGDNLEFIQVNPNNIPANIYCIAYNIAEEDEGPGDPVLKHITGQKFNDWNGNGSKDEGDSGLADWTIYATQQVGDHDVDANGAEETQTGLINGEDYLIRVSGTYDANDFIISDAMYSQRNPNTVWTDLVQTYESYGTELLDLQVKVGAGTYFTPNWGTFNPAHVYWLSFTSSGNDLSFKINDVAYNNTGKLGVTIYKVIASTTTDSNGNYDIAIPDGTSGDVIVAEQTVNGWYQTMPMTDGYYAVNPSTGATERDFGNHIACGDEVLCVNGISGNKFNDVNGDLIKGQGDNGLAGVTIYLDLNENNALDNGEPYTITDEYGNYSFSDLPTGTYYVRELVPNGWEQTSPSIDNLNGEHKVQVLAEMMSGYDFGNRVLGGGGGDPENPSGPKIAGFVYRDNDSTSTMTAGDVGLAGWLVYMDTDNDGMIGGGEVSTITAADGSYSFTNVANGSYNIRQVTQAGWNQVEPSSPFVQVVNMTGSDISDINFGNTAIPGGSGGGGSGGGGGGAGGPAPLSGPGDSNGQVLGIDTNSTPTPPPMVLGAETQLPRTGFPILAFVLILMFVAMGKKYSEKSAS